MKVYVIEENGVKLVLGKMDAEKDLGVMVPMDGRCWAQGEVAVNRAS